MSLRKTLSTCARFMAWPPHRITRRIRYVRWLKTYGPLMAEIRRIPCLNPTGFEKVVGDYKKFMETGDPRTLSAMGHLALSHIRLRFAQAGVGSLAFRQPDDRRLQPSPRTDFSFFSI